jgi:DDE superfamily endonuclease
MFMCGEPHAGWRHGAVTGQRTKLDFAQQMKWLVDEQSPEAEMLRLVMAQLNTHKVASLYDAFAPEEARRIARKLEIHSTPKPGSWLHLAEIALRVLPRQCLDRRIPNETPLKSELAAWEARPPQEQATVDWRFSVTDAREKLNRLYPSLSS